VRKIAESGRRLKEELRSGDTKDGVKREEWSDWGKAIWGN